MSDRPQANGNPPPATPPRYVDFLLYAGAAVTYIGFSIYNKWLLDWIVGPVWLILWVWVPTTIWRLLHGQPVRPRRDRREIE